MPEPKIAAIVLQYGHWQKTVESVASLLNSGLRPRWIIVVDNASPDDSAARVEAWLHANVQGGPLVMRQGEPVREAPVIMLRMPQNGGYAAGNNAGMRLGRAFGANAFLLLNNDAALEPDALNAMWRRLMASEKPGLCGAIVLHRANGGLSQCVGGGYTNYRTGLSTFHGAGLNLREAQALDSAEVEKSLNFICGACVLASSAFLDAAGYMDEGYFLYCEEQDWVLRAGPKFDLVYARDAVCRHYEGASSGWSRHSFNWRAGARLLRSRLRLAWRHHPHYLPIVACCGLFAAVRQIIRKGSKYGS